MQLNNYNMLLTVVEKEKRRKYSGEVGVDLGPRFLPSKVIIYYQCDTGFLCPKDSRAK